MSSVEATVLEGDALERMRELADDSIDVVITDPPYCSGAVAESRRTAAPGQGLRSESRARFGWFVGDNMGTAGLAWLLRLVAFEACRVVRPSGHFLCFMDWRMVATLIPAIESSGLRYQNLVVWDKGSMGLGKGFRMTHELVGHFTNGAPEYHARDRGNGSDEVRPCPGCPTCDPCETCGGEGYRTEVVETVPGWAQSECPDCGGSGQRKASDSAGLSSENEAQVQASDANLTARDRARRCYQTGAQRMRRSGS